MTSVQPKDVLISKLWLPIIEESKKVLRPRRRRNFDLRLFTLSDGLDFSEVDTFESHDLLNKSDVVAWTFDPMKKLRADTEGFGIVIDGDIYSDFLDGSVWQSDFQFDIMNFDFTTQPPPGSSKRIEIELENLDKCFKVQQNNSKFLLIYTTCLDGAIVTDLVRQFDVSGLLNEDIDGVDEKQNFIKDAIVQLATKNGFGCVDQKCSANLGLGTQEVYSVVQILKR